MDLPTAHCVMIVVSACLLFTMQVSCNTWCNVCDEFRVIRCGNKSFPLLPLSYTDSIAVWMAVIVSRITKRDTHIV